MTEPDAPISNVVIHVPIKLEGIQYSQERPSKERFDNYVKNNCGWISRFSAKFHLRALPVNECMTAFLGTNCKRIHGILDKSRNNAEFRRTVTGRKLLLLSQSQLFRLIMLRSFDQETYEADKTNKNLQPFLLLTKYVNTIGHRAYAAMKGQST